MASFEEKARKALDRFYERPVEERNALVAKVLREEAELPPPDPRFQPILGSEDILRQLALECVFTVEVDHPAANIEKAERASWRSTGSASMPAIAGLSRSVGTSRWTSNRHIDRDLNAVGVRTIESTLLTDDSLHAA